MFLDEFLILLSGKILLKMAWFKCFICRSRKRIEYPMLWNVNYGLALAAGINSVQYFYLVF